MSTLTFDTRTGRVVRPPTEDEIEEARAYIARQMEDPCYCEVNPEPHWHGPRAYSGVNPDTGAMFSFC